MLPSIRLHRGEGEDRVAVVSVERSSQSPNGWLIKLARGNPGGPLRGGTVYGPFDENGLEARFDEVVSELRAEGFARSGLSLTIAELTSPSRRHRAFAALRLGRLRAREAVEPLVAACDDATDELCSILDALGQIGDRRALPVLRRYAERKLLSRRRSAVEALRNLRDEEGLEQARARALESLEPPVRAALESDEGGPAESVPRVVDSLGSLPLKRSGRALDTLYELATPPAVAAVRRALEEMPPEAIDRPFVWRYLKSILKRSMLRRDFETLGLLTYRIEARGVESLGLSEAMLKSGRDGHTRATFVFRRQTQRYVRRSVWRYLRYLARYRPKDYSRAAAETVVHYGPKDERAPRARYGAFAHCYLLNRVLLGGSKRLELVDRKLKFRFVSSEAVAPPEASVREEAYADLWDAEPRPYLRLLTGSRLVDVQRFACQAVETRHPELPRELPPAGLVALLGAPYEPSVQLGLGELNRRFDPVNPDWELLERLLVDERESVHAIGASWLAQTASRWSRDVDQAMHFLALENEPARRRVGELLERELPRAPGDTREALAARMLDALRAPEPEGLEGLHLSLARLAVAALVEELNALLDLEGVLRLIEAGSPAGRDLGGVVLGRRGVTFEELGPERTVALARSDVWSVREAAHAVLRGATAALANDPSILFDLAETDWLDTRGLALETLRDELGLDALGASGLVGLCDSNRVDVQNTGRELVLRHFHELSPEELLFKLAEHPHRNMRRFALELVEEHLPEGAEALSELERFFRAVLYDLWPERDLKRRVLGFLEARGLADARQAQVVVSVLDDYVRTRGKADFERTLEVLARLRLRFPDVRSRVELVFSSEDAR